MSVIDSEMNPRDTAVQEAPPRERARLSLRINWVTLTEITAVILAAVILTRPWLNLDPLMVPPGGEYLGSIQTNFMWTQWRECGACVYWFGSAGGGYPAFAEATGSHLHPLVILTSLLWGMINGSKLALVGAYILMGLAQWWLGRELGVGVVGRLWSAVMGLTAAHITSKLQLGAFSLVISGAATFLVLPAILYLARRRSYRAAAVLGVLMGLCLASGVGYFQVALALATPAILFLLPWRSAQFKPLFLKFVVAAVVGVLVAGPFLVPFAHFMPNFAKDFELDLKTGQPLIYIPLNLVIKDYDFYTSPILNKLGYPSHTVIYTGWLPVLLAILGLTGAMQTFRRRSVLFLVGFIGLVFWASSGGLQLTLIRLIPLPAFARFITGARYVSFMSALAVPAILGLAAIGVDRLVKLEWPRLAFMSLASTSIDPNRLPLSVDLRWLLLLPLGLAWLDPMSLSSRWLVAAPLPPEVMPVLRALKTTDLQWVNPPGGTSFWIGPAVDMRLKLAQDGYHTWRWSGRDFPKPAMEARVEGTPEGMTRTATVSNIGIFSAGPGREYAAVTHADNTRSVCSAAGLGGNINVTCETTQDGLLTVQENSWSGWKVAVDGGPATLLPGNRLAVELPAGRHTVEFRYRPWDVPLGLALGVVGLVLAAWLLARGAARTQARTPLED